MTAQRTAGRTDLPERIGRYRIVRPLSKGGMALVYEARRESLAGVSPRVAIKVIIPDYADSDQFQELFINEARLGAQLHHQNLVQIQDFDRDGANFFLVMEYVEGLTLRRLVTHLIQNRLTVPLDVVCEIGRQVCDGLHYAHTANDERGHHLGLVHRDVKPSNLILNPQGVVKILDFGISKGRLMKEKKGQVKGTWGYMSPEQANGLEVGPPADVFGVAAVLFEIAAKTPLFEQRSPDEIKKLLDDDHAVRKAATLDPAYSALVPVLLRALQRDPSARYPTAGDFGRALSELMQSPITARDELKRYYEFLDALEKGTPPPARMPGSGAGLDAPQGSQVPSQASLAASQAATQQGGIGSILWATAIALGSAVLMAGTILMVGGGYLLFTQPVSPAAGPVATSSSPPPSAVDEPPGPAAAGTLEAPPPTALRTDPSGSRPPPGVEGPTRGAEKSPSAAPPPPKPPDEASFVVRRVKDPEPTAESPKAVIVAPTPVEPPPPVGTGRMTLSATPGSFEIWVDGKLVNKGPISRMEFSAGKHVVQITAEDGRTKTFDVSLAVDQEIRKIWDFERMEWRR